MGQGLLQIKVIGLENLMNKLGKSRQKIAGEIRTTLREVGTDGLSFARSRAPVFTGELQSKIIAFPESHNVWVVASEPTNDGFPLNVAFDEGNFGAMTMRGPGGQRIPFKPRNPSLNIGFMKKTNRKMRRDLNDKLRARIERLVADV